MSTMQGDKQARLSQDQVTIQNIRLASKTLARAAEELAEGRRASAHSQVELAHRFLDEVVIDKDQDRINEVPSIPVEERP